MTNKWAPIIIRKRINPFPNHILQFFHEILVFVENDENKIGMKDWRKLNSLKTDLTIFSDTGKSKIQIPSKIELGSIYFKEENSKSKNFIKNLRHAYAHNYIIVEDRDIIKIALPTKNKKGIKLACYISFKDLKTILHTIKIN